jgi:hypothetical protein
MGTLNQMVFYNNIAIVSRISDGDFLKEFFTSLHKLASFDPANGANSYIARNKSKKEKEQEAKDDVERTSNLIFHVNTSYHKYV